MEQEIKRICEEIKIKFNMAANIIFKGRTITPKKHIRILGIQIDTKLRWKPHLQKIEEKNATQILAISRLGASI